MSLYPHSKNSKNSTPGALTFDRDRLFLILKPSYSAPFGLSSQGSAMASPVDCFLVIPRGAADRAPPLKQSIVNSDRLQAGAFERVRSN